jgi:hypothetical protein
MIPVGPYACHKRWLGECLASVQAQTLPPAEVLLVDDMAGVQMSDLSGFGDEVYWAATRPENGRVLRDGKDIARLWRAPWRLGGVGAFNCGVALARNDLVFMLSCDDSIRPKCLELCVAEWEKHGQADGYYYVGCHYSDGRPDQTVPFSGAMVTKGLWRMMGGFPIEAGSGAGDAALISILMAHLPAHLIQVAEGQALYDYRVHSETETANAGPWWGIIGDTRGIVTKLWKPPKWGRMA